MDSYTNCLLYLKVNHGFTDQDLSDLLEVPKEVIQFFVDPIQMNTFELLREVLRVEGVLCT